MKVLSDFRNDFLKRREVVLELEHSSNPGFELSIEKVSEQFKTDKDKVVVKAVRGNFGSNAFMVEANVYDSVEMKDKIEPKKKEKKNSK